MSLVRVIIATTQAPVSVLRITEEDPVVNSVVCLSGKAMALPISPAYDAFVRDPTGVIQRHFGHSAFRTDVSEKIDEGYSWQLGLFTAHALQSVGRLAQQDQEGSQTVITTGEVDRDLNVLAITGTAEKVAALRADIEALIDMSHPVTLVIPKENADQWQVAFADLTKKSPDLFKVLAIDQVGELLTHLDIALPGFSGNTKKPEPASRAPNKSSWIAAALVLLIGVGAIANNSSYRAQIENLAKNFVKSAKEFVAPAKKQVVAVEPPKPVSQEPIANIPDKPATPEPLTVSVNKPSTDKSAEQVRSEIPTPEKKPTPPAPPVLPVEPSPGSVSQEITLPEKDVLIATRPRTAIAAPLKIQISELRAPVGFTCAETRQMKFKSQIRPANLTNKISQFGKANDKLCSVEIVATASADSNYIFGRYQRWTQGRPRQSDPDKVIDLGPRMGPVSWTVDIPSQLPRPAIFQVLILSSNKTFDISQKTRRQLNKVRPGSDVMRKMKTRLQKLGVKLTTKRIRIIPEQKRTNGRPPPSATTTSGSTWQNTRPSPPPAR